MPKVNVDTLNGKALDYAVALALPNVAAWIDGDNVYTANTGSMPFNPTNNWDHAGPVIENENITVCGPVIYRIGPEQHAFPRKDWRAMKQHEDETTIHANGPDLRTAALRVLVKAYRGREVEIPDNFVQGPLL